MFFQNAEQEELPLDGFNHQPEYVPFVESPERQKSRKVFDSYDADGDGLLTIGELKILLGEKPSDDLPKGLADKINKMEDSENGRWIDFEAFFQMTQPEPSILYNYCVKYCQMLVPKRPMATCAYGAEGQYEKSMVFCPPPSTMALFSVIEIIFFIVDVVKNNETFEYDSIGQKTNGPMATIFIYNPVHREEIWRFMTYMFVHIGIRHIMTNLVVQILLGLPLECVHSWWRVSLVYLAGVFSGSLGTSIANPDICLAGASGGVYALMTAHIATVIMNWSEMEFAIFQLFVILVFCGIDLGASLHFQYIDDEDTVGYTAHLCGALAGLLVGICVLKNLEVKRWEKALWWISISVYITLMGAGILFHIFNPTYFVIKN